MFRDLCHSWPHVTKEVSQMLGCDFFGHILAPVTPVTPVRVTCYIQEVYRDPQNELHNI